MRQLVQLLLREIWASQILVAGVNMCLERNQGEKDALPRDARLGIGGS